MEYKNNGMNVGNFVDSYRNIGYTIETAIADIIDNSIFSKASEINVDMIWDDYSKGQPLVRIIDNGIGMNDEELIEAMQLACKSPYDLRDPDDLGRFGLGLKSASFSQCITLTVMSRKKGYPVCCKRWELDHIKTANSFEMTYLTVEESGFINSAPKETGTVVIWSNLDQLSIPDDSSDEQKELYWNQIKKRVYNHIALTFGSFKDSITFKLNNNIVDLWDPFLSHDKSVELITDERINDHIRVRSYIIPHDPEKRFTVIQNEVQTINDLQGFYIFRNNRLIMPATWLDLPRLSKKEAYRLARIRIDIDNTLDKIWHIDIKKESAVCPPFLQEKLISYAKKARLESSKKFSSKGKSLRRKIGADEKTFMWTYGIKNEKPYYQINRKNPVIHSFQSSLNASQSKDFNSILSFIENHIPVMSILEQESKSNGEYTNNIANEIGDEEVINLFIKTVENYMDDFNLDYSDAVNICRASEPFDSHLAAVDRYLEEELQKTK